MGFRRGTLSAASAALATMFLGLAALGVASFGIAWLRVLGFSSLVVAGVLAGVVRYLLRGHEVDRVALELLATAQAELKDGNPAAAARAASKAIVAANTPRTRNRARVTLAWAALGQGYPERAKAALDSIQPRYEVDVYCLGAVEHARGRTERAIEALEVAREFSSLNCDGAKLLVDCHFRAHGIERALFAAYQNRRVLGAANCRHVLAAAGLAGKSPIAATLTSVLSEEALG